MGYRRGPGVVGDLRGLGHKELGLRDVDGQQELPKDADDEAAEVDDS